MIEERNKPYEVVLKDDIVEQIPRDTLIKIYRNGHESNDDAIDKPQSLQLSNDTAIIRFPYDRRTLYDGRYCAVSAFVFAIVDGKYSVLANQRGEGTPDFQGYWNCPCGFLERNEDSKTGAAREIREETMEIINPGKLKIVYVETEPEKCNNGNVTIRHRAFIGKKEQINNGRAWTVANYGGGEKNEVNNVLWIPVDNIDLFEWAFHHEETIRSLVPSKWKRRLIEWYFKYMV